MWFWFESPKPGYITTIYSMCNLVLLQQCHKNMHLNGNNSFSMPRFTSHPLEPCAMTFRSFSNVPAKHTYVFQQGCIGFSWAILHSARRGHFVRTNHTNRWMYSFLAAIFSLLLGILLIDQSGWFIRTWDWVNQLITFTQPTFTLLLLRMWGTINKRT